MANYKLVKPDQLRKGQVCYHPFTMLSLRMIFKGFYHISNSSRVAMFKLSDEYKNLHNSNTGCYHRGANDMVKIKCKD